MNPCHDHSPFENDRMHILRSCSISKKNPSLPLPQPRCRKSVSPLRRSYVPRYQLSQRALLVTRVLRGEGLLPTACAASLLLLPPPSYASRVAATLSTSAPAWAASSGLTVAAATPWLASSSSSSFSVPALVAAWPLCLLARAPHVRAAERAALPLVAASPGRRRRPPTSASPGDFRREPVWNLSTC